MSTSFCNLAIRKGSDGERGGKRQRLNSWERLLFVPCVCECMCVKERVERGVGEEMTAITLINKIFLLENIFLHFCSVRNQ